MYGFNEQPYRPISGFNDNYETNKGLILNNKNFFSSLSSIIKRDIKRLSKDIKRFEPTVALDGGNDGLDVIKKVIYKSREILKLNGLLALEIGNGQYKEVSKLLISKNFRIEHKIKDYKDNIRCIIARKLIR